MEVFVYGVESTGVDAAASIGESLTALAVGKPRASGRSALKSTLFATDMQTKRDQANRTTSLMVLVFSAVALMLGSGGCKRAQPASLPPPIVQVMEVAATNASRTAEFIGQLDSPQNVEVRARVEAFVDQVLFQEGHEVKAGDPLFLLDMEPFKQRLAAAKGALAEAEAALKKNRADVARLAPLAEKKAVPLQDLDNALASVSVGEANVESAQARVKSAELDLTYCDVRALVSGLIGAKQVSVGSLVGKGSPTLLATISQLHPMWVYCSFSDVEYLTAQRIAREHGKELGGLPVTLILPDGTEHPEGPGKWVFVDRAMDVTTGTIRARAEFSNTNKVLRPGMFARVRISVNTGPNSILVPERAVAELQGKSFVWTVGADSKAARRPVQVAPNRIGESLLILEGLTPGERIVVEGLQKVHDGAIVQPMTAAQLTQLAASASASSGHSGAKPGKE